MTLSESDLKAMTAEELVAFAETLGIYLDPHAEKKALLGRLIRLGVQG